MLKKTNLSAQNDCLHTYVTEKSNLQSQGRKITGTKHDPKYGHFPIPKEGNRITYIQSNLTLRNFFVTTKKFLKAGKICNKKFSALYFVI